MNVTIEPNGWNMLKARLDDVLAGDSQVRRRSDQYAKRLAERQAKVFAKILARPQSRAYRDYVLVSGADSARS